MTRWIAVTIGAAAVLHQPAQADTILVEEDFESYADTTAMEAVWTPDLGQGNQPTGGPKGILVPDFNSGLAPPYDNPPDLQGQGVNILDNINEYNGPNSTLLANLVPTETQSIRLTGDIFDNAEGNKRTTIGLRNDSVKRGEDFGVFGWNFVELGFWNADTFDPTSPSDEPVLPSTGYAYRVILFGQIGGDLMRNPNWQYFPLDAALDRDDDADDLVNPADIGPGWHTYSATISTSDVTLTLDLFRDGINNATGEPGVDSAVSWEIVPHDDPTEPNPFDPFNSLRFGGASGVTGNVESVVDNIKLELIDLPPPVNADFNADNQIDGNDFAIWQRGFGNVMAQQSDGDANGDGVVDDTDRAIWENQFGTIVAPSTIAAVPEPATSILLLGTLVCGGVWLHICRR